jgi:hypothetical protein
MCSICSRNIFFWGAFSSPTTHVRSKKQALSSWGVPFCVFAASSQALCKVSHARPLQPSGCSKIPSVGNTPSTDRLREEDSPCLSLSLVKATPRQLGDL